METIQTRYSESTVLSCLEQSAIVLDDILAHGQQGFDRLPIAEQHAAIWKLSVISNVLICLCQHVIPAILADRNSTGLLRQQAMIEMLMRISKQARALELRLEAPPARLN